MMKRLPECKPSPRPQNLGGGIFGERIYPALDLGMNIKSVATVHAVKIERNKKFKEKREGGEL